MCRLSRDLGDTSLGDNFEVTKTNKAALPAINGAMVTTREETLEQIAREVGAHQVRKQIERAKLAGRGAETPAGIELMKRAINPLTVAIEAAITDAEAGKPGRKVISTKLIKLLAADVMAYLTLKVGLSAAISGQSLTHAAMDLGAMVEEELRLCAFEDVEPNLYHTIMRQLRERGAAAGHARRVFVFAANKAKITLPSLTRTEKMHLGVKLIELLVEATGFIDIINLRISKSKTQLRIRPTDKVTTWINDRNLVAELMKPRYLATVDKPREWTSLSGGGYHSDVLRELPLVKRPAKAHLELLRGADLGPVLLSLNAVQNTGWRINTRVLELLKYAWDHNIDAALPRQDGIEVPPKPVGFNPEAGRDAWKSVDPTVKKAWMVEARRIHELNAQMRGKRINLQQIIVAADELSSDPVIYFPHQLDFRGRAYAVPIGLNPQGPDHARALLTFAEGKPIDTPRAAGWLMIQGANLFGFDKANLEERIAWVEEHTYDIANSVLKPFNHMWWTEADKPWCFLAWCHEYIAYHAQGYGYVSSLPISVDGSCNGLQHFSAMLRDPIGGAAVNLVPSPLPSDIYQRVADRVIEKLKGMKAGEYINEQEFYARGWLAFGIDRKITKRPVMVLPYGGTFRSCMAYVRDAVNEKIAEGKQHNFGADLGKATAFLAKLVWESISDVVVAARTAMDWLQKVARVAAKAGVPLSWKAPSGFVAYQAYKEISSRQVKTKLQGSIIKPRLLVEGDSLDPDRQALGVSPNFVHSMDAAAMMLTIEMAMNNGVSQFAMIHDSYGTVAADMDMLAACLREAFVDMYRDHHVLEEFLAGLPEEVRAQCPPVPEMGTLALEDVLQSEFFFA